MYVSKWIEMRGPETPLSGMIPSFLLAKQRLSAKSLSEYERYLREYALWSGDEPIRDLSPERVNTFIRARKAKSLYAARYACAVLKSFASWLADEGYLSAPLGGSVLRSVKTPRVPTGGRPALEDEDISIILRVIQAESNKDRYRDGALFWLLFSTGVRRNEAHGLRLSDVVLDLKTRLGYVDVHWKTSKGLASRRIRLGPLAVEALHRYIEDHRVQFTGQGPEPLWTTQAGKPFKVGGFKSWLNRLSDAFEEAGVKDWKAHRMRHTWATWYHRGSKDSGATVYDLKREGGWKDLSTPLRYTKDRPWEELAAMPTPIETVMAMRRTA